MIIAMLIGLISTWYGHNVALRVRSISSFSMGRGPFLNVFGVNAVNDHYYCLLVVAQPQLNNDSIIGKL